MCVNAGVAGSNSDSFSAHHNKRIARIDQAHLSGDLRIILQCLLASILYFVGWLVASSKPSQNQPNKCGASQEQFNDQLEHLGCLQRTLHRRAPSTPLIKGFPLFKTMLKSTIENPESSRKFLRYSHREGEGCDGGAAVGRQHTNHAESFLECWVLPRASCRMSIPHSTKFMKACAEDTKWLKRG